MIQCTRFCFLLTLIFSEMSESTMYQLSVDLLLTEEQYLALRRSKDTGKPIDFSLVEAQVTDLTQKVSDLPEAKRRQLKDRSERLKQLYIKDLYQS